MIVKMCGLTRVEDAVAAVRAGADWIGLNFWPRSRRVVGEQQARRIVDAIRVARADVEIVGVFVHHEPLDIDRLRGELGLDRVQLHGDEPPEQVQRYGDRSIKAVGVGGASDLEMLDQFPSALILLDTPSPGRGGSGIVGDWQLARRVAAERRVLLAGGLTPDNVAEAIEHVMPYGVDVASGIETSPGIKDADLMARFVDSARQAFERAKEIT